MHILRFFYFYLLETLESWPVAWRLYLWGISRCASLLLNLRPLPVSQRLLVRWRTSDVPASNIDQVIVRAQESKNIHSWCLVQEAGDRYDMRCFLEEKSCSHRVWHIKGSIWCPLLQRFLSHSKVLLWCVDLTPSSEEKTFQWIHTFFNSLRLCL